MAKNTVSDWDSAPINNADIAGINIAEGCPAGGLNDAIRTLMAQMAAWIASATGPLLKSGGILTGDVHLTYASAIKDSSGAEHVIGYRGIPIVSKSTGYTVALSDVGTGISTTANVTVPANAAVPFAIGDTVALYNNGGSSISVGPAGGVTLRLAGSASTGSRTLAQRGLGTLVKVAADEWVISGMGVS